MIFMKENIDKERQEAEIHKIAWKQREVLKNFPILLFKYLLTSSFILDFLSCL